MLVFMLVLMSMFFTRLVLMFMGVLVDVLMLVCARFTGGMGMLMLFYFRFFLLAVLMLVAFDIVHLYHNLLYNNILYIKCTPMIRARRRG